MKLILRQSYLDRLIGLSGTPDVKALTGVRRCGKSVLLKQYKQWLEQNMPDANIIFVNLKELDYEELLDYHKLHAYVCDRYKEGCKNIVMIDEIALCSHFELAVGSLHAKQLFDIYLTVSSAIHGSADLAALFPCNVMEVKVYPFSFSEYMAYFQTEGPDIDAFDEYVRLGGMPGSLEYPLRDQRLAYIDDVYKTILDQDIVKRHRIRSSRDLYDMSEYMMSSIGSLLSPSTVTNVMNASKCEITRKTVDKYIKYLMSSFVYYEARRYDLNDRKSFEQNKKYYLCDHSFRYAVNGVKKLDFGKLYENIVYFELLRRGYEVYVGILYHKEIDFIAVKQDEKLYIQVTDSVSDSEKSEEEIEPLLLIKDDHPKMVIARTRREDYRHEGVLITDIAMWLLKQ